MTEQNNVQYLGDKIHISLHFTSYMISDMCYLVLGTSSVLRTYW